MKINYERKIMILEKALEQKISDYIINNKLDDTNFMSDYYEGKIAGLQYALAILTDNPDRINNNYKSKGDKYGRLENK